MHDPRSRTKSICNSTLMHVWSWVHVFFCLYCLIDFHKKSFTENTRRLLASSAAGYLQNHFHTTNTRLLGKIHAQCSHTAAHTNITTPGTCCHVSIWLSDNYNHADNAFVYAPCLPSMLTRTHTLTSREGILPRRRVQVTWCQYYSKQGFRSYQHKTHHETVL